MLLKIMMIKTLMLLTDYAVLLLTVGVCPAFGVMGIVVGTIFKSKKFPLSNLNKDRIKKANFLGIVSLFLFVVDIILLVVFKSKFKA